MFLTNSECVIGVSDAFSVFVYGYPSPFPRAHCTPNKNVPTLRYTRRPGPIYTGHACRHLLSAVPWISEDRLFHASLRNNTLTALHYLQTWDRHGNWFKRKTLKSGGGGGCSGTPHHHPRKCPPEEIKIYAIWGYPEVIFMEINSTFSSTPPSTGTTSVMTPPPPPPTSRLQTAQF